LKRFEEQVVKPFVEDYLAGRTPIPCAQCNNFIKFDQFLEMADGVGADKIATGHYARLSFNPETGRYEMRTSVDANKDQTYFLFGLTQAQLARTLFPLGGMAKPQVRELAKELGLPVADKNDSQEICFVPGGDYANFIKAYLAEQGRELPDGKGEIVDTAGQVVGEHGGTHRFTVGQRRGLGVAAGEPLYVISTDPATRRVHVISTDPATRRVHVGRDRELMKDSLIASGVNWLSVGPLRDARAAQVKIRNKHAPAEATLVPTESPERVEVRFRQPQRAVTPGQAAVFYEDDLVLGGGWID